MTLKLLNVKCRGQRGLRSQVNMYSSVLVYLS